MKRDLERAIKGNDRAAERVQKNALLFMPGEEIVKARTAIAAEDQAILDRYKEQLAAESTVEESKRKREKGKGGKT